jgi:hypothetical protein
MDHTAVSLEVLAEIESIFSEPDSSQLTLEAVEERVRCTASCASSIVV